MAGDDDAPWRALAAAAGLGGVLFAVWLPLDDLLPDLLAAPGSATYLGYYLGWVVAALALAAGAYGLYRFRGDVAGTGGAISLGLIGLGLLALAAGAVLEVATVSAAGGGSLDVSTLALAADVMFAGLLLAVLGGAGLGAITFRVAGFDRRAGLLLVVALFGLVVALALDGEAASVLEFDLLAALCSVPYGLAWVVFGRSLTAHA